MATREQRQGPELGVPWAQPRGQGLPRLEGSDSAVLLCPVAKGKGGRYSARETGEQKRPRLGFAFDSQRLQANIISAQYAQIKVTGWQTGLPGPHSFGISCPGLSFKAMPRVTRQGGGEVDFELRSLRDKSRWLSGVFYYSFILRL